MKIRQGDVRRSALHVAMTGEETLEIVIVGEELGEHFFQDRLTEFQRRKRPHHIVVNQIERLLEITREEFTDHQ